MVLVQSGRGGEEEIRERQGDGMRVVKKKGMQVGKYKLGKILGEGNFGKVKYATNIDSGHPFAIKILEKNRIIDLNTTHQIKREIGTLKLIKHPNVVRLYEESKGKRSESEGRKLFQQLTDGISYCHKNGVFHRDLKLENILVDSNGNIKITDFGLSALPQHFRDDGLLHTTCGSPNYVAPEILSNRGYDGATSDTWSCGVILYVILTGYLPFDDRNLVVLYQKISKGDAEIPKWLSSGAQNLIKRILDPSPCTRITMAEMKEDEWFRQDCSPALPDEEEDEYEKDTCSVDEEILSVHEAPSEAEKGPGSRTLMNAFQLIGMSSCLDLSGFFEKEDVSERKIRFTSTLYPKELLDRIENTVTQMNYLVQRKNGKLKVVLEHQRQRSPTSLSVTADVFGISQSLYVVELRKSYGDPTVYRQLCNKLSGDLGVPQRQELLPRC